MRAGCARGGPIDGEHMTLRGACDTHVHVYDQRYPISPSAVLTPPDASPAEYRAVQSALGLDRVVFVQPTTYGLDNRCQLDAVAAFGDAARAVVVVDDTATDDELTRLTSLGARGARFHMLPGGAVPWEIMHTVAERIATHRWHIQLQLNGRELVGRLDALLALPAPIVIDHVGRFMPPVEPADPAFGALLTLLDTGRCWVKLSAPYESTRGSTHVGAPHFPTVATLAHRLVQHAPERMLWATNWPHPGQVDPPTPTQLADLRDAWLPTSALRRQVLVANPAEVYGFGPDPTTTQPDHPQPNNEVPT
jgi:D-galactarolactone isomerase